jgi:hypothetical protein
MSTSHSRFLRSQPTGQPSQDVALKIAKERERQQALLQSNATFISAINSFLRELKAVFHTCNLTRAHMMHVVNNLSAFLMFEVMETTWMSLEQKIDSAQSLNDVIVAHDNYLAEILERSLLSKNYESLNIQLQKLLNLILEFCYYEENLVTGESSLPFSSVPSLLYSPRNRRCHGLHRPPAYLLQQLAAPEGPPDEELHRRYRRQRLSGRPLPGLGGLGGAR